MQNRVDFPPIGDPVTVLSVADESVKAPNAVGRPRSVDPMISLSVKLPRSLVERIRADAAAAGTTVSATMRAHLTADAQQLIATPPPRRRQIKKPGEVSGVDPALLHQLAAISSNVVQIARKLDAQLHVYHSFDVIEALILVRAIESRLHTIAITALSRAK